MDGWRKKITVKRYTQGLHDHLERNGVRVHGFQCDEATLGGAYIHPHYVLVSYRQGERAQQLIAQWESSPMRIVVKVLLRFATSRL